MTQRVIVHPANQCHRKYRIDAPLTHEVIATKSLWRLHVRFFRRQTSKKDFAVVVKKRSPSIICRSYPARSFGYSAPIKKMLKNCEEFPLENIGATR